MKKKLAALLALTLTVSVLLSAFAETVENTPAPVEPTAQTEQTAAPQTEQPAETQTVTQAPTSEQPTQNAETKTPSSEPTTSGTTTNADDTPATDATDTPSTEAPATDATDAPSTEAPATDATDAPSTEAPATDATDAPSTEAPATDATDAPSAEAPATDATDAPSTEAPATDATTPEPTDDQLADAIEDAIDNDTLGDTVVLTNTDEQQQPQSEGDVGEGPVWIVEEAHRRYGSLDELLPIAIEQDARIFFTTCDVFEVSAYTLKELRAVKFAIDAKAFEPEDEKVIILSKRNASGGTKDGVVFVWVGEASEAPQTSGGSSTDAPAPTVADVLESEIMVQATERDNDAPLFTLAAIPELTDGEHFAVMLNGGDAQPIEGGTYVPTSSGEYRFGVLAADGTLLARSAKYTVTLAAAEEPTLTDDEIQALMDEQQQMIDTASLEPVTDVQTSEPTLAELTVTATGYAEGQTVTTAPRFDLSGASGSYFYAVAVDNGSKAALTGSTYVPSENGEHTYVFYLCDGEGYMLDTSRVYVVSLDTATVATDGEAWTEIGGSRVYGSLAELLTRADSTVYLKTSATVALSDASRVYDVELLPDPDVFVSDNYVIVANDNPDGETAAGTTYAWVGVKVEGEAVTRNVAVNVSLVNAGLGMDTIGYSWINPTTSAVAAVEPAEEGVTYYLSLDNGQSYGAEPYVEGMPITAGMTNGSAYQVCFKAVDATGVQIGRSDAVTVRYDAVAPIISCVAGSDGMLYVYGADALSGITAKSQSQPSFSQTYSPMNPEGGWSQNLQSVGDNVYRIVLEAGRMGVIPAGSLAIRDKAGNVTTNPENIQISSANGASGFSTGGTSGFSVSGSTGSSRTVSHSTSEYDSVTAYNGVELSVGDDSMTTLTVGGEALDLTIALDEAEYLVTDAGYTPSFTAAFADWESFSNNAESDGSSVDTLVLTASTDALGSDQYAFSWSFDGTVYKKLAASGIDYLAFKVGDRVTALSTAGFSAGVRYNMYRAQGLASKSFDYTVRMGVPSPVIDMSVTVEGDTYAMTANASDEFYYYDVYTGTTETVARSANVGSIQG